MTTAAWLERARANVAAAARGEPEPYHMVPTASVGGDVACPECGSWCDRRGLHAHLRCVHGIGRAAAPRPGRGG
jgi:hypothetical protein